MKKRIGGQLPLVLYDLVIFLVVDFVLFIFYRGSEVLSIDGIIAQSILGCVMILGSRIIGKIYNQIWRYGGIQCYIRLLIADTIAFILYLSAEMVLPVQKISCVKLLAFCCMNTFGALAIRMFYRYAYKCGGQDTKLGKLLRLSLKVFAGGRTTAEPYSDSQSHKIKIAIIGAGRVGVLLAEELLNNPKAAYVPICFIEVDQGKIGRYIQGVKVLSETEATLEYLVELSIQEIVFAVPDADGEKRKRLYEYYKATGCKLKTYDYPVTQTISASASKGRRHLREFDIEELLFRNVRDFTNDTTRAYYKNKVVLISGGGGSIGSELSRQIAKMEPRQLIILDIYENCAYDIQQELKSTYGDKLDLQIEIVSICDRKQLEAVFDKYHPDIVLHAAAHKHVPLMEHNCCEAVKNNVFGTLNIVEVSEKYGVSKFTMISTDKAVNPTNVMGATKRMCEMIVQSRTSKTNFSATRFGNVLGSNGSVIPLFKRQIAGGGPVTLTDRRIIRYFMTIPEASQLVLTSGAMAKNGELYVLDMGNPVKILELAENMIRLSGFEPYKDINIIETGLRPGEKLYEELLIKTEELDKTDNSMIFIERDAPLSADEITEKLEILQRAMDTDDNDKVREALKKVVPTYHAPEEVNTSATETVEETLQYKISEALPEARHRKEQKKEIREA